MYTHPNFFLLEKFSNIVYQVFWALARSRKREIKEARLRSRIHGRELQDTSLGAKQIFSDIFWISKTLFGCTSNITCWCKADIFRYLLNFQDTVLIYFKHYMLMQSRYLSYMCLSFRCTNRCVSFLWEFCELLTGSIYCQSDTVIISGNRTNNMFFPDNPDISDISDISDFPVISGISDILILPIFLFTCLSSCLEGKSLMRCTYHCILPNMSYSKDHKWEDLR